MKKILIALLLVVSSVMMAGCNKSLTKLVKGSMSEITNMYFSGEGDVGKASISVGEREDPYILNGVHHKSVGFSLVVLSLNEFIKDNSIDVEIKINDNSSNVKLELDPKNNTFIQDLGYRIKANDSVSIAYNQKNIVLSNVSKDFQISSDKAIELCAKKLEGKLNNYVTKNYLSGECYLKIMQMSGDKEFYWGFTFLATDGKSFNAILNVNNEEVIV